ncbi:MAG: hypothetical protein FWC21_01390 [Treponema sp.]|nr:hypothetical protein [Treponema sp.]
MSNKSSASSELDLHYIDGDPDVGIAPKGVLCKDLSEISKLISQVKKTVKKINLDNQHALTSVPPVIGECGLLEDLDISHTNVKEIPDFVFALPSLRSLSIRLRELENFPGNIINAANLETLYLRLNKGWKLPENITELKNLKILVIDFYSDAPLPENLGELSLLEDLSIMVKYDERTIPDLPASFAKHKSLKKITVNDLFFKNRKTFNLDKAAKILSSCPQLESLKMSGIAAGKGHQNISHLANLKEIELRHLLVDGNIFDSIKGLNKLERICVLGSEFKVKNIPDIFEKMTNLHEFTFAGNMVLEIPPSIYSLANLKTFEFGCTGISHLDNKIAELKNLESIQIHDNLLDKLPENILALPKLKILNIEENLFNPGYISAIKKKIDEIAQTGRKIEFFYDRQGHRQAVKRLRGIHNIEKMNAEVYANICLSAAIENSNAIKYINLNKLKGSAFYPKICMAAVRKSSSALENIIPETLGKQNYFLVCMEAAKCQDIGSFFNLIRSDMLSGGKYIQICLLAALHNKSIDFIEHFNTEEFQKRFGREIYEHVCFNAALHLPRTITKMINPTKEIQQIAAKQ